MANVSRIGRPGIYQDDQTRSLISLSRYGIYQQQATTAPPTPGVTATFTDTDGNAPDMSEQDLRDAGYVQRRIELTGAIWLNDLNSNNAVRLDIINGLYDSSSAENDAQFEQVRALMRLDLEDTVIRISSAQLILQFPPTAGYDITTQGSLRAVVPASAYTVTP